MTVIGRDAPDWVSVIGPVVDAEVAELVGEPLRGRREDRVADRRGQPPLGGQQLALDRGDRRVAPDSRPRSCSASVVMRRNRIVPIVAAVHWAARAERPRSRTAGKPFAPTGASRNAERRA